MCLDTCLLDKAYCDIPADIYMYIYKKYVCVDTCVLVDIYARI